MAWFASAVARKFPRVVALLALLLGPARLFAQLPLTPTVEMVEHAAPAAAASLAQTDSVLTGPEVVERVAPSVVLLLAGDRIGQLFGAATGVAVRPDGTLLTAYHAVRDARSLQVRLHNGETYDRVELLAFDERRDIAVLRIPAAALPVLPSVGAQEVRVGDTVYVVSNPHGLGWTASSGILSAFRSADEVPGAGRGYRLLQFTAPVSPGSSGGLLVDARGRALGIVVGGYAREQGLNFAVPLESVLGLVDGARGPTLDSGRNLALPTEKGALSPEAARNADRGEILRAARTVFVRTRDDLHIPTESLIAALYKHKDFQLLQLSFVQDERAADLVIEIDHPAHVFDFSFIITDRRTSVVLASGSIIAWDGIRAAGPLAKKIVAGLRDSFDVSAPRLKPRPSDSEND
ncbi:MAG: S1C family serine protease [Candidatus Acidiferrales bacterium]